MSSCGSPFGRIKMGEVFHTENNGYEFTCDHCLYDFKQFAEFTAHVEEYLEEMISCEQAVRMESESESASPSIKMINFIGHNSADQTMLADEVSEHSEELRDNVINVALENELNTETENGSLAGDVADDEVYIVIDDDDSANEVGDDDDDGDYDDDDADDDIENEPDDDGSRVPLDGGYKCPLCKSCYSTIDFLQMHLSNFHSKNTIYKYLAVATTSSSNEVHHMNISKRIEDLPSENILLDDSSEAAEYSKYIFEFRFEKTATGMRKCPKCEFTGNLWKVKNHVFTHLKKKLFTCLICQQKFNTLPKCRLHMRKVHLCT